MFGHEKAPGEQGGLCVDERRCEVRQRRATATAVMFTIWRTVADGVRMCAGAAAPSKIRAHGHALATGHLQHVEEDVGGIQIRTDQDVGGALQRESGSSLARTDSLRAASPCISPSAGM